MRKEDKEALERYQKKLELARSGSNVNPYETVSERLARIDRAIKDPKFMVEYYFPHYASAECADFHIRHANKVHRNKKYKGFTKWGRAQAKSVWDDIFIAFREFLTEWRKGNKYYVVLIGSTNDKAKQLLGDLQAEFEANPQIINDLGEQKTHSQKWEEGFFMTKSGFIGQALGAGQNCRGLKVGSIRPMHIIIDDVETKQTIKNERIQWDMVEWVERELLPTMDGEIERLCIANNWFAPLMFIRKLAERHPDWDVDEVKAYDPRTYKPAWHQKYSDTYFLQKEKEMGTLAALAEYNHEAHIEGKIFKQDQIQWAVKMPRIDHYDALVIHWDVAYADSESADYNAMRFWGVKGRDFFYIDSYVKQSKMKQALEWLADIKLHYEGTNAYIHCQYESQFWNEEVERTIAEVEVENDVELGLIQVDTPRTKKFDRILSLQVYYQNGRVYYNPKKKGHNDTLVGISQLCGIEPGYNGHDDAPDADEQCIRYLSPYVVANSSKSRLPQSISKSGIDPIW